MSAMRDFSAVDIHWINDWFCCTVKPMALRICENSPHVRRWTYTVEADEVAVVLPDGCIDIIVLSGGAGNDVVRVTDLDLSPRPVKLSAGTSLTGFRLRPGTMVDLAEIQTMKFDSSNLETEIENKTILDQETAEIIEALSLPGSSVDGLAKQQGVSERTLQRQFKSRSLPAPGFWRQLGRARRAVQALPCRLPLSEIALEYGYSDQAHMTREFVRWFGQTPVRLRQTPSLLNDLTQPGLGNWSEEIRPELAGLT